MVHTTDYPTCPYCGEKYEDFYELPDGDNIIKCWGCGKTYLCSMISIYIVFEGETEPEEEREYDTKELPSNSMQLKVK